MEHYGFSGLGVGPRDGFFRSQNEAHVIARVMGGWRSHCGAGVLGRIKEVQYG